MSSGARDGIVQRIRFALAVFAAASAVGCGSKEDGANASASARPRASIASSTTASPPSSGDAALDPVMGPSRCADDIASTIVGTARFEKPTEATQPWTLVMRLAPPRSGAFDVTRRLLPFGAIDGTPTATLENGTLVVRARVKFTGDPVATVVLGVKCGEDAGSVSAGIRWSDGDMEPGKRLDVQVTAFGHE